MTQPDRPLFLSAPRACAIAHRGGAGEGVENTLPAFARAVGLGYSHVELDVHLTRDGHVVIHHDATLARVFGDPRAVAALDWAELRQVRAPSGEGVPRLADLLESHPDLFVTIELKSETVAGPLAALLKRMGAVGRVCLGSFNPARVQAARQALGVPVLWSPAHAQVARLWLAGFGLPVALDDFAVVQVPPSWNGIAVVTPRFVRAAHRRGVAVQVWTVNARAQMDALLDMGVDGLMTDQPSLLREVLARRGQWG